jgi:hypothetical protein
MLYRRSRIFKTLSSRNMLILNEYCKWRAQRAPFARFAGCHKSLKIVSGFWLPREGSLRPEWLDKPAEVLASKQL